MDNGLRLWECVNTLVDGIEVAMTPDRGQSGRHDHYGVSLYACSNTTVSRVVGECANSCVDLSGNTPNMNTYIEHCMLFGANRTDGLGMHENAYNTVVTDCVLGGMLGYGTVKVARCRFVQRNRQSESNAAIMYRGSHKAEWATLMMEDCTFEGSNLAVVIAQPVPQSPIQAYNNVIGEIYIRNCSGGKLNNLATSDATILSSTVKRIVLDNWRDCYEIYNTASSGTIESMEIKNCSFTVERFINNHSIATYLDNIKFLDYRSDDPCVHKIHKKGSVYADNPVLPEGVQIQLSSSNSSAKFRICGANLVPNVLDDYFFGSVSGSIGAALTRTVYTGSNATLSINGNGDPVYTQSPNNTGRYTFYPVGMYYVPFQSTAAMSAVLKNTGGTDGAAFYPYIAIVDCKTGFITYKGNGSSGTASASGVSISHSREVPRDSVVLFYFSCGTAVAGSETTFEDISMTITPSFIAPVVNEDYKAKRLTGDGTLTSFAGVNNIMCSETTFNVKYEADLVNNPISLVSS